MKYLSGSVKILVLGFLLLASLAVASKAPIPTCNSPDVNLWQFPISLHETQTYNMNDIFSGYNLNITIPTKPNFVYIREKLQKTQQSLKSQPGLKNYHLDHNGNKWGNTLVTISVDGNSTILRWGATVSDTSSIPELSNEVTVENDTKTLCYDAVWFRAQMIALVDCSQTSPLGLKNVFIYVNTSSKAIIGKVFNDLYVPFNEIYHRKIRLLTEDNYHYLIRAYFAQHVDEHYSENTYVEIMSVNNPLKPWTIRVMDRSFLHQDKLSITDFQVYLGDIYILDYFSGIIKFDITKAQTIVIVGRYRTDTGFTKMGVYSNNLDNQFLLVLAHDHAIFQVDWSNQIKPQIITKYSIPDNSWIHDLWVNELYVIVQLTANLTYQNGTVTTTQSTYVFTRGARTYMNAYVAIPHPDFHAFVDFERDNSQLLTFDTVKMAVYQLSTPIVSLFPQNADLIGKPFIFTVIANSINQYTGQKLPCTFTFNFTTVPIDSLAIWPTGLNLPETYYANYPGQLFIPLSRLAFGSNLTYGVIDKDIDPPTYFILQQNSTRLFWNKKPTISKYSFLRMEQYDELEDTDLFLYTQDMTNTTHFSHCQTIPYTDQVHCRESGYVPHISWKISNLTANRFHYYENHYLHLAAVVFEESNNQIFIYEVDQPSEEQSIKPITFPTGYEGKIQNIEFLGQYIVVVLKYVKEIVFFDMVQCYDHQQRECHELYRINATTMRNAGVKYFSPVDVYTSDFHPYVLFIKCLDRVVIVDVTRNGVIKLAEVKSPATQEPGIYKWKMGIARGQLILVNPPYTIEEHDLDELYTNQDIPLTKAFPTFGYIIPDKFDLDFSDKGNLIYITATDPKLPITGNSIIMVYRTGLPAVSSLYDVFHLEGSYDDILIDATGNFGDYVAVAYNTVLMMFRQYEAPILVFEDVFTDFSFNVTYTNEPGHNYKYSRKSSVKIANYPEDIIINNTQIKDPSFISNQINYNSAQNEVKWTVFDDSTWFNGSVLNYTLIGCSQCNEKIKAINHVQQQRELLGVLDMNDYAFSAEGGFIQSRESIIKMNHNGSIDQFVSFPSVIQGQDCIAIEHSWIYDYTLSACKGDGQVYLYTTVYTASKPFVNGPYYSSAKHIISMHVMEELMIIVDVDENPFNFDRQGGVIIYAMNHDPFEPQIFDELQIIDTNDLTVATDWVGGPAYIGNANFAFTNMSQTYRLVISQLRNGFFVVDFKWTKGRKSVEILKVDFVNMAEQMNKLHIPLPNMAFFTAIAINKQYYDETFNYWLTEVIVTTSNFHSFLVNLRIDKTGTVVGQQISKIFYRYGFYQNQNYIKAFDGYFAIAQKLPIMQEIFDYTQMVLSVYDTRERWTFNETTGQKTVNQRFLEGTNIPIEYILGGQRFNKGKIAFDWNFTFTRNTSNPFTRLGLLALHERDAIIKELSVHEKLIIQTFPGIQTTQQPKLRASNDFHNLDILFKIDIEEQSTTLPGWAIALIVIGSIAIAAVGGYILFVKFVKGKKPNRESEAEKSLLDPDAQEVSKDSDDDSQDEDEEDESDEQEEAVAQTDAPKLNNETIIETGAASSINRETVSSVGDIEQKPAEVQEEAVEVSEPKAEE